MFVNNIDPVLLKIGFFQIRYYGLIFALGFVITYVFLKKFAKQGRISNVSGKEIDDLVLYLLIGVVIGARVFYFLFYNHGAFFSNPLEFIYVWHGGLSFHGGLVGAAIGTYIICKKRKIKWLEIADAISIPAVLALGIGRIGNFTNQELYGTVTNVAWCVKFAAADMLCRHPYQIYAALGHFLIFGILLYYYKRQKVSGNTFLLFVLLYGIVRLFTDIFREEAKYFGISTGQALCIVMIIVATFFFIKRKANRPNRKSYKEKDDQK